MTYAVSLDDGGGVGNSGCMSPTTVAPRLAVAVSYRVELDGGVTAAVSEVPLWFTYGDSTLSARVQAALLGKRVGDRVAVRLEPGEAFGVHDAKKVLTLPRQRFAGAEPISLGERLAAKGPSGTRTGVITALDTQQVTIDLNSPWAGAPVTVLMHVEAIATKAPT